MDPVQILLVAASLVVAAGGVVMLYRDARKSSADRASKSSADTARKPGADMARRPYIPLAITFIGLMIAYRSLSDFQTLEPIDFLLLWSFIIGLLGILGMQFFIIDRQKKDR